MLHYSDFKIESLNSKEKSKQIKQEATAIINVTNPAKTSLFKSFKLYITDAVLGNLSPENKQRAIYGLTAVFSDNVARNHDKIVNKRHVLTSFTPVFTPMASAASKAKAASSNSTNRTPPSNNDRFDDTCCCSRIVKQIHRFFSR